MFAATDEMKAPLSFPRTRLNRTHKTTSMNASSITSQPNFVIFSIMAFAGTRGGAMPAPCRALDIALDVERGRISELSLKQQG